MQKFAIRLIFALSILLSIHQNSVADTYPKREMRAAWVTTAWSNDWPTTTGTSASNQTAQKAEAQEYIQRLKAAGFNAVFFQVRGMSDRNYAKNSYTHNGTTITVNEPWTSYISGWGKRGTDPGWDPLAFWIDECHKQGMELHAWINPYRFGNIGVSGTNTTLSTEYPWNHSNDQAIINAGWIIGHHNPNYNETQGMSYFILNPALSEVKTRIMNVCKVLTYNYDIDGIAFDDYFYPEGINDEGTSAPDYSNYQTYLNNGGTMSIENWRRNHINDMISKVHSAIKSIKPFVKFGVAPAGVAYLGVTDDDNCPSIMEYFPNQTPPSDWQYNGIFSDPIAWMRNKDIDYISPQLYWTTNHKTNNFTSLSEWWSEVANIFERHFYPSHSLDFVNSNNTETTWSEVANQVKAMRSTSVDNNLGSIFFASRDLTGKRSEGLAEYLYAHTYQNKAITPAVNWYEAPNPGAPKNFKHASNTLTWDAVNTTEAIVNAGMRYAVYAIPLNTSQLLAKSTTHPNDGGFRSEFLVDFTYSNSTNISNYPSSSYWYAVTIVDRYGNEWEATTINAPIFEYTQIELIAPTSGTAITDNKITFSWDGSEGATFKLQISEDASFESILNEITTTELNATISCEDFKHKATYYWRVIASKNLYNPSTSETRSFISPALPSFNFALTSPENLATIETSSILFKWDAVENASFTLQISKTPSFEDIIVSKKTTDNNYNLSTYNLSQNTTYYWRVIATLKGYQDYITPARSFSTSTLPEEYEKIGNLSIKEIWNFSNNSEKPLHSNFGENQRSMTAYKGNVYIITQKTGELLEFNGQTGEYSRSIYLTGECFTNENGKTLGTPTNCIFVDSNGHLCVSNMITSASSTSQLTVCTIDLDNNGYTTRVFQSNIPDASMRIDYASAFNDVTNEGGQIWAAVSSNGTDNHNYIYRWTRKNDDTWTQEYTIASSFYPTGGSIGGAPVVLPISKDQFIVDGNGNYPTLYTFNTSSDAIYNSGFDSNTNLMPASGGAIGLGAITIGNYPLFIYNNDNRASTGYNFNIAFNPSFYDFSKMKHYWTAPTKYLGNFTHSYGLNSVATIKNEDNSATIFLYAPKNGLAAYRISLPEIEISLDSPADNTVFEEDFDFSWNGIEGASYTLEISKTSTFEKIEYTATTTSTSYNSSNFNFASKTQYFWRVKASHPNYTANTSEVRQFTSPVSQWAKDNLTITELWNKSVNKGNFPDELGGVKYSMVAYNGNVYVITRETGALLEFNGSTGAYIRTITLTGDCFTNKAGGKLGFATNCIFVDGNNNLCVSNLVTSFSTDNPLTVCTIDVNTGNTTRVFQSSVTATMRIDYANAFGDVTKEGGQIWGAVSANGTSNHNRIYRWTRNSNGTWTEDYTTIAKFYPTAGNIGGAPWVMPITETDFLVDGSGNDPTLYTFVSKGNATYKSGFDSNKSIAPNKSNGAGVGQITLGKYPLFIYNYDTYSGNGYKFNIVHNPSSYDFSQMEKLWTVPENYLGANKYTNVLNQVATIKNDDNSAKVFVYAPSNGLAAYRISLPNVPITLNAPINNAQAEDGFDFVWTGIAGSKYTFELSTSESFNNIVYTTTTDNNTLSSSNIKLSGSTKYYWRITAVNDNYTTTTSSVGQFISPALPEMPITLNQPKDNVQTLSGFDFIWTGVDDAEYTLELSTTPTFESVAYSSKTSISYYSSNNFPFLPNATTYYWRVIGTHDSYAPTTSAVESFITPAKPSICKPVHYLPNDKESLNSDIVFVAIKAYLVNVNTSKLELADNSILEISTDKDFTNIIYTNNQWVDVSVNGTEYECIQHTLPISYFTNGTYYWRIHAQEEGYDDVYSEPYSFVVTGQSDIPDKEENYVIEREDNADYSSITEYISSGKNIWQLTNLWVRNSEKNYIERWNSTTIPYYRSFCTRHDQNGDQDGKDLIWLTGRTDASGGTGFLEKYDASTGEYIGQLDLGTQDGYSKSYPCNSIFLDDANNICISNLTLEGKTLQISTIDPKTGKATPRFSIAPGIRIDHVNIYGDIISGTAYVFGASGSSKTVFRWVLEDGVYNASKSGSSTVASIYPTSASNFGTAPRVYPVDHEYIYIDGYNSSFTLYKFTLGGTATTVSTFAANSTLAPKYNPGSGGNFFLHDAISYIVYPVNSFSKHTDTPDLVNYNFNIARVVSHKSWDVITNYWTIPNDKLGGTTMQGDVPMLVDYLQYDALTGLPKGDIATYSNKDSFDRTNIYIYVPGNGMAAYSLSRHIDIFTGAEGLNNDNININTDAQKITFGCDVDQACIYTLSGMMVNTVENASSIEKPATKGVYILQLTINGVTTTHKIVI